MKKVGKNNQNHSGSSGRQSCIVVCCGSVYRAEWDHYGRCDWYRSYDQPLFSGKPIDDYFGDQCGAVRSRCSIFGKEVCIDNDHQFLYLSIFLSMAQSIPGIDKVTQDNAMLAALYGGFSLESVSDWW